MLAYLTEAREQENSDMLMGILLQALLCFTAVEMATAANKTLHFSFITAFSGGTSSSGGIPIVDFALEEINNDTNVLNDYELRYPEVLDSKVKCYSIINVHVLSYYSYIRDYSIPSHVITTIAAAIQCRTVLYSSVVRSSADGYGRRP